MALSLILTFPLRDRSRRPVCANELRASAVLRMIINLARHCCLNRKCTTAVQCVLLCACVVKLHVLSCTVYISIACLLVKSTHTCIISVVPALSCGVILHLSLIHISEPTRLRRISYAVFCL